MGLEARGIYMREDDCLSQPEQHSCPYRVSSSVGCVMMLTALGEKSCVVMELR